MVWRTLSTEEQTRLVYLATEFARLGREYNGGDARAWLSGAMVALIIHADIHQALALLEHGHSIDPLNRAIKQYLVLTRLLGSGNISPESSIETALGLGLSPSELASVSRMLDEFLGRKQ